MAKADFESLIEKIVKKQLEDVLLAPILDKLKKEITLITNESAIRNHLERMIISYIEEHFFDLFNESFLIKVLSTNEKEYMRIFKELFTKMLRDPTVQQTIQDQIMDNYISNIPDTCVLEDMVLDVFKRYKFQLVAKK